MNSHALLLGLTAGLLAACSNPDSRADLAGGILPPPLALEGTAFEAADNTPLEVVAPLELPGLRHVYHLSGQIITGAEPADPEALRHIARLGVQTILSVDGKIPDVETAEALGMRYVHVPIQYVGMTDDELMKIAKTFRELEGPFYVHCFHGKHRGPAAGAVGRVVLDGVPRDRAIAEMRQWCTTSSKYEGLYSTVAMTDMPTPAETAAYEFDFTSQDRPDGVRAAMVSLTRNWDNIKLLHERDFAVDPEHPDVDPLQEVTQLYQHLDSMTHLPESNDWNPDYRTWFDESYTASERLMRALSETSMADAEGDTPLAADSLATANAAFGVLSANCTACHDVYRNN